MRERKRNWERIAQHLEQLKKQKWLAESQRRWPNYLYHFTDIKNAKSILIDNALFSRHELEKKGKLTVDIASPEIIRNTPDKWKDYVRLYFRPKTPTQYRNEGIRPKDDLELGGAHCPVPVVFIFKAVEILSKQNTKFSNGNLRVEGVQVDDSTDFFESLPFDWIYHDQSLWGMEEAEKNTIVFHRNAEVIVPTTLDLESLCFIYCRSQAEFETFIYILPFQLRKKWKKLIGVDSKRMFFFSEWSFFESVFMNSDKIVLKFNESKTPGPFHARLEIEDIKTHKNSFWEGENFNARETQEFDISRGPARKSYIATFLLDGNLAYQNYYFDKALLF